MSAVTGWLAAPASRLAVVLVCFAIGCTVGGVIYVGKREDRRADRERAHERKTRKQEDQQLADLVRRLSRVEHVNSAQIDRLIRHLTPRQSRRLALRLLRDLSPRQRAELGLPPAPPRPAEPSPGSPRRNAPPAPGDGSQPPPSGGGSPGPGPGLPPLISPLVPHPPTVDPPPLDLDGDGPLPPLDLPPTPRLPGVILLAIERASAA